MFLKRILVPVDFSIRSRAALGYAVGLARATGAEIDVLHVVAAPSKLAVAVDAYSGQPLPHASPALLTDAHARMDALSSCIDHAGVIIHQNIREFVVNIFDPNRGNRRAGQGRQENAAHRVAKGRPETWLEWLNLISSKGGCRFFGLNFRQHHVNQLLSPLAHCKSDEPH